MEETLATFKNKYRAGSADDQVSTSRPALVTYACVRALTCARACVVHKVNIRINVAVVKSSSVSWYV
jgi:hypothetical protein